MYKTAGFQKLLSLLNVQISEYSPGLFWISVAGLDARRCEEAKSWAGTEPVQ